MSYSDYDFDRAGQEMHAWASAWYPICRSITGDGLREQLQRLGELIPLEVTEVPTGTPVLDWTVPQEWNIREAWVKDAQGKKVIDFAQHNLHVMGYSAPVHTRMDLPTLKQHCHTLPAHPDWIPYRTSYYKEQWAFCATQRQIDALPEGEYEVYIDSSLGPGALSYGTCVLPGETDEIVLCSAHVCHPSLANDNLASIAVAVAAARWLQAQPRRRYTFHFIFAPGTIGAISWLAQHRALVPRIRHGMVLACLGDSHASTWKRTRQERAEIDVAVEHVLRQSGAPYEVVPFSPYGYDERQYCSPGFNLPVGCLMRSQPAGYPEYHSSADNLALIKPENLADSLRKLLQVFHVLEGNRCYENLSPYGEPQLGRRGLYGAVGGRSDSKAVEMALLWVLNYSDGHNSLLEIAERAGMAFDTIEAAAAALGAAGLLRPVEHAS